MTGDFLWWRDGIIYQIYPRSFADSNGDGIGDLSGITARLDYLSDLGVDALWLSPVNPSPDVDYGYDVSDYNDIDRKFGTLADFDHLLAEAHRREIRIILDLVLNHTSDQHEWFQRSCASRDNSYRDWYIWRDPSSSGGPPNNWQSTFGGSAWQFDSTTGQYYYHMFYPQQPDLNWHNPCVRQAMLDVFRFWLERGVGGFRLDVFNMYFKHPETPSNPRRFGLRAFDRQQHLYDCDQPELLPMLSEIRALVESYPQRYIVGETFLPESEQMAMLLPEFLRPQSKAAHSAARYCASDLLPATFNFRFLGNPWSPASFFRSIQEWEEALGTEEWPTYVLNNHDNPRSATRYERGEDDARLKVAAAMLLTLRGTPFLYYGEEIGMRDIPLCREQVLDPIGRRYWPVYKGRDGCRAPMQWDESPEAGFTNAQPWLPVHPDATWRNAAMQMLSPDSLYHFYRRLIHLRRAMPALTRGMFLPLTFDPHAVLAYLRQTNEQTVLVALNFSHRTQNLVLGSELSRFTWINLLSSRPEAAESCTGTLVKLGPYEAILYRQENI